MSPMNPGQTPREGRALPARVLPVLVLALAWGGCSAAPRATTVAEDGKRDVAETMAGANRMAAEAKGSAAEAMRMAGEAGHVAGEALVQFRPGTTAARIDALLGTLGLARGRSLGMPLGMVVTFPAERPAMDVVAALRAQPEVLLAEPNRINRLPEPPRSGPELNPSTPGPTRSSH